MEFKISFFILILVFLLGINCVCAADNGSNAELIPNGNFDSCDVGIIHDGLNSGIGCDDGVMANEEAKIDVVLLNVRADENISSSNIELADADSQSNDNKLKTVEENKTKSDIHLPKLANDTVLDIHAPKLANDAEVVIHDPISHSFEDLQKKISDTTSGDTLDLFENYKSQKGLQVEINKDLTIDGHGHILDFLGKDGHSALTQAVEISP